MTYKEAVNWIINLTADIGKIEHQDLWHYEQALSEMREMLESAQPERKAGRWIESNPLNSEKCRLINCSECGKGYIVNINVPYEDWTNSHKFCVKCGAKMKEEENE